MAILNNLIVKGDTRFIGEAGGNFAGTFNGFDLKMAEAADISGEAGSVGLISSTDKRDLDKLIARVAGFATTAGTIDSNSRCAAYTATISGIGTTLTAGTVIYIKMHAKSAANATLDVNNIGAKSIYWRTSAVTNDKLGLNYIFMLVYDGTNWVIPYDYDTNYSATSLGFGYATCSTAKDAAAKTVSINNYSLNNGGIVAIKFTNGSNVANPTLNINSRGAKNIYYNGAAITLTNDYFIAGLTYLFVFDGTQYQLIGVNYDTNYGICSTAADTAAKTVNISEPFLKVTGAHVTVKFTVTNTASSPTLNVNSTGAAAIYYRGSAISAGYLAANRTYEFVFNGTQYELIGDINTDKVTNTVNTTAKAYITGTTSAATNTGAQIFDTGVYLENTAGNFHVEGTVNGAIPYGDCSTAADTAAKTVTVPGTFSLVNGARVTVRFTVTNSADNPTLNVNDTGAKPIIYRGSAIGKTYLAANRTYQFIYNSDLTINSITGVYEVIGDLDTNSTYSNVSLGNGYAICTTASNTAAKTATLSNYSLGVNGRVSIEFDYDVPANATLNINSKGAKPIYYKKAAITANIIKAGDIATFIYDGTNYNLIAINNIISNESMGFGYGVCDTAASTTAKTVSISNYKLSIGSMVSIKFNDDVSANATLNINSTGAKAICYNGGYAIIANIIRAGDTATFIYDGTNYNLIAINNITNESMGFGYGEDITPINTPDRMVVISNYKLTKGGIVSIKFSNKVPANATLSINGTGDIPIYYNSYPITDNIIRAGNIATFIYDGTNYNLIATDNITNESMGQGYGECSTAASTTAKTVSISNYKLTKGGMVSIEFDYDVPANATLNINSKGVKSIYYKKAAITANIIKAGDIATFIYDGTNYKLISIL